MDPLRNVYSDKSASFLCSPLSSTIFPRAHNSLVAVPPAPLGFTLGMVPQSPNTLSASWMEPDPTNGVISGYTVTCNFSSGAPLTFSFNGSVRAAPLDNLTPFTSYTCTISATTGAGTGTSSGPQTASTNEDGMV